MKRTRRESFVIRIWFEEDQPGWQGWVQHASSGETTWVRQVDELLAFMEKWTGNLEQPDVRGLK